MEGAASAIVGRDAELATIQGFLQDLPSGPRALLIQGEAGIGKTTLWRAAISAATHRGYTVLPSKPVEIETKLSFTGLGDLLEQHVEEVLLRLPDPQRRALEIALLRADAAGSPPDQRAVSLAVLSALRVLASSTPLLVAIDDVQWLDPSSASVLAFAARRIDRGPVGVVACLRLAPGHADPLGLDEAFPETRIQHISLAPLRVEALGRIFKERLKAELPPSLVHLLQEVSGGNPFFAIEIARALERQGERPRPGEPIPVPATLEELLRARLARLSDAAREALLVASAAARPTIALVESALRRTIGSSLREARGRWRTARASLSNRDPRSAPSHLVPRRRKEKRVTARRRGTGRTCC
jgi:predicted ATPase